MKYYFLLLSFVVTTAFGMENQNPCLALLQHLLLNKKIAGQAGYTVFTFCGRQFKIISIIGDPNGIKKITLKESEGNRIISLSGPGLIYGSTMKTLDSAHLLVKEITITN